MLTPTGHSQEKKLTKDNLSSHTHMAANRHDPSHPATVKAFLDESDAHRRFLVTGETSRARKPIARQLNQQPDSKGDVPQQGIHQIHRLISTYRYSREHQGVRLLKKEARRQRCRRGNKTEKWGKYIRVRRDGKTDATIRSYYQIHLQLLFLLLFTDSSHCNLARKSPLELRSSSQHFPSKLRILKGNSHMPSQYSPECY